MEHRRAAHIDATDTAWEDGADGGWQRVKRYAAAWGPILGVSGSSSVTERCDADPIPPSRRHMWLARAQSALCEGLTEGWPTKSEACLFRREEAFFASDGSAIVVVSTLDCASNVHTQHTHTYIHTHTRCAHKMCTQHTHTQDMHTHTQDVHTHIDAPWPPAA